MYILRLQANQAVVAKGITFGLHRKKIMLIIAGLLIAVVIVIRAPYSPDLRKYAV